MSIQVRVGAVAHGGHCVARHEGRVLFVRHALPGELVEVAITSEHDRYAHADAVRVVEPSPDRVPPPCPHAGPTQCGGCDFQHVSPQAQRRLKADVIAEQFDRLARLTVEVVVEELSGGPLGWRSRIGFAVDDEGVVGLRRHRSHVLEPIQHCPLATDAVNDMAIPARRWPGVRGIDAVASSAGDRAVLIDAPTTVSRPELASRVEESIAVSVHDGRAPANRVRGHRAVREFVAAYRYRVSIAGFWQVHPAAPARLAELVLEALEPRSGETVLDLYGGAGLFARMLAERVGRSGRVTVIESDPIACRDAAANLRDAPATARVRKARVDQALAAKPPAPADLVVLDPPRAGAGAKVVKQIAARAPRAIAYVSCDPATLARDVATFAAHGYRMEWLRALDCFPMTAHVECVAALVPTGRV